MFVINLIIGMALVILAIFLLTYLITFLFPIIEVCGSSMFPTYKDGEILFGTRFIRKSSLKVGDVVLYNTQHITGDKKIVIKRIADIKMVDGSLYFMCLGDNSKVSYDSRYYGYVPSYLIIGKPMNKYQRKQVKE